VVAAQTITVLDWADRFAPPADGARTRLRVDGGSASSVMSGVRLGWDAAMAAVDARDFHMAVMAPAEMRASKPVAGLTGW